MAGAGPPAERSDAADRSRAGALRVWANLPATASQDLENRTVSCGLAPCIRSGSRRPFLARIMSSRPRHRPLRGRRDKAWLSRHAAGQAFVFPAPACLALAAEPGHPVANGRIASAQPAIFIGKTNNYIQKRQVIR